MALGDAGERVREMGFRIQAVLSLAVWTIVCMAAA